MTSPGTIDGERGTGPAAADPSAVLRWAVEHIPPGRLILTSSFGPTGMVNIHLLSEIAPKVPVVFIDTLYHFAETLEHARHVTEHYGLDLRVYRPAKSREAFEAQYGEALWQRDLDLFHELTRTRPLQEALRGVHGWITGRRRDQSPTRIDLENVEFGRRVKINPLASWGSEKVWSFIHAHGVPYNPLHDSGYASVGDEPLTTPVAAGEHERAGRWRGHDRLECGIHLRPAGDTRADTGRNTS